jgi:hypothetical protein
MEIENVPKVYVVDAFEICLKCGARVQYNLRIDKGHSFTIDEDRDIFVLTWPESNRVVEVTRSEIAVLDHQRIVQKEIPPLTLGRNREQSKSSANTQQGLIERRIAQTSHLSGLEAEV